MRRSTTPATPDPSSPPGAGDDAGVGPDQGPTASSPHWVKAFGIVALVVVLLVVVMLVAGRGGHGPGRHSGAGAGYALPAGQTQRL